jgi:hypothetical protein
VSISAYDVGDSIRLGNHAGDNDDDTARTAFTDITGVATNPTTVSLELLKPDTTEVVYGYPSGADGPMTQEGTGRYYRDVDLDQAGLWHWKLIGTGTVETAEQGALYVRRSMT